MRKKLIISNIIILFLALIVMLFGTNVLINKTIETSAKREIENYLNIAYSIYDGKNHEETSKILCDKNEEIRITFIDSKTYDIIYDYGYYEGIEATENHGDRPELLNLGTFYIRYSETMDVNMMYLASVKDGVFIRVAVPLSNFSNLKNTYIYYSIGILIIISIYSTLLIYFINKRTLKPINIELQKLSDIVNETKTVVSIDNIASEVDKTRNLIQTKIDSITKEKEKLNFVINSISQGFIILDNDLTLYLINNNALKIFNAKKESVIFKNITYLTHDKNIIDDINKCKIEKNSFSACHQINNKSYLITFSILDESWQFENSSSGIALMITDMENINQVELMKKDFFQNASHELKSPLTTIIGNLQMISQGIINDKDTLSELIKNSEREAKRMSKIITEMLELAYLETNEKTEISNINLKDIVIETITKFEYQIKEKNIAVNANVVDNYIDINLNDVYYLVSNLVENAIKYNKENGKIDLTLTEKELIVKDSGIGISDGEINRIFERFYRVDKARSKALGGTGLGLSIVKHIANKYHFDIKVNSILNVGSTFKIIFKK